MKKMLSSRRYSIVIQIAKEIYIQSQTRNKNVNNYLATYTTNYSKHESLLNKFQANAHPMVSFP